MNEFQRKLLDKVGANSYIATLADSTREILHIEPYAYIIDIDAAIGGFPSQTIPVAGLGAFPTVLNADLIMDNDSDFLWCATTGANRVNVNSFDTFPNIPTMNPSLLVQVTDRSKGVTMFSGFIPLPMVAGQAGYPFLLNSPKLLRPRSTLRVQFTNDPNITVDPVTAIYMALHGAKIYYA